MNDIGFKAMVGLDVATQRGAVSFHRPSTDTFFRTKMTNVQPIEASPLYR